MELQTVYYTTGLIFMVAYLALLIAGVVLLFYIKKKINEIHDKFENRISAVKEVIDHPEEVASAAGSALAATAFHEIGKLGKKRRNRR